MLNIKFDEINIIDDTNNNKKEKTTPDNIVWLKLVLTKELLFITL